MLIEPLREEVCDTLNTVAGTVAFIKENGLSSAALMIDNGHLPLGKGAVQCDAYFAPLKEFGYVGPSSVEIFPDDVDEQIVRSSVQYRKPFIGLSEALDGWRWR